MVDRRMKRKGNEERRRGREDRSLSRIRDN